MKRFAFTHGEQIASDQQLASQLSRLQYLGLTQARQFGWTAQSVRYSNGNDFTVCLRNPLNNQTLELLEDGTLKEPAYVLKHKHQPEPR
ncbi:MAG TPA: hypothetical protein VIN71_13170 [Pseudomonadales bacterium]